MWSLEDNDNGNISSQAGGIKIEFKLYWGLWYKTTPRKDLRASKTQKILRLPNLSSYTCEKLQRVFLIPQLHLKYCSVLTFSILWCILLPFSIFCSVPWSNLSFKYLKHLIVEGECLLMVLVYPSWIVQQDLWGA